MKGINLRSYLPNRTGTPASRKGRSNDGRLDSGGCLVALSLHLQNPGPANAGVQVDSTLHSTCQVAITSLAV